MDPRANKPMIEHCGWKMRKKETSKTKPKFMA